MISNEKLVCDIVLGKLSLSKGSAQNDEFSNDDVLPFVEFLFAQKPFTNLLYNTLRFSQSDHGVLSNVVEYYLKTMIQLK